MKYLFCAAMIGASIVGVAGQATAADLIVTPDKQAIAPAAANTSIYVQLLGGVAAGLDTVFTNDLGPWPYTTESGYALAATIGVVVMDGLSVEGDLFYAKRSYTAPYETDTTQQLSLMANVKYTAAVTDSVSVYGAVGLGWIWDTDSYDPEPDWYQGSGLGYQLIAGAALALTDNISLVGEARYQDTFEPMDVGHGSILQAPNLTGLAGLKLSF